MEKLFARTAKNNKTMIEWKWLERDRHTLNSWFYSVRDFHVIVMTQCERALRGKDLENNIIHGKNNNNQLHSRLNWFQCNKEPKMTPFAANLATTCRTTHNVEQFSVVFHVTVCFVLVLLSFSSKISFVHYFGFIVENSYYNGAPFRHQFRGSIAHNEDQLLYWNGLNIEIDFFFAHGTKTNKWMRQNNYHIWNGKMTLFVTTNSCSDCFLMIISTN